MRSVPYNPPSGLVAAGKIPGCPQPGAPFADLAASWNWKWVRLAISGFWVHPRSETSTDGGAALSRAYARVHLPLQFGLVAQAFAENLGQRSQVSPSSAEILGWRFGACCLPAQISGARADAVFGEETFRVREAGGDAGGGDGFAAGDAGGDIAIQGEELGEEVGLAVKP